MDAGFGLTLAQSRLITRCMYPEEPELALSTGPIDPAKIRIQLLELNSTNVSMHVQTILQLSSTHIIDVDRACATYLIGLPYYLPS